jgi:carbon storage regulator
MLLLSRRSGQSIIIGDHEIVLRIIDMRHGVVRLGIEAPKNVAVHREEVYVRILKERAEAMSADNQGEKHASPNA